MERNMKEEFISRGISMTNEKKPYVTKSEGMNKSYEELRDIRRIAFTKKSERLRSEKSELDKENIEIIRNAFKEFDVDLTETQEFICFIDYLERFDKDRMSENYNYYISKPKAELDVLKSFFGKFLTSPSLVIAYLLTP